jgi:hypothetical protein
MTNLEKIKDAITNLHTGMLEYSEIFDYITNKFGPINSKDSFRDDIEACTVNIPSRVNYGRNKKPRKCNDSDTISSIALVMDKSRDMIHDLMVYGKYVRTKMVILW